MANTDNVRMVDGSTSFEGGIDSGRVPTIQSPQLPTGLKRNQLAWMTNCTVRGGGVLQRTGWVQRVAEFTGDTALFQGATVCVPDGAVPYLIASLGGRIFRFNVWTDNSVADITGASANPPNEPQAFFCQAEDLVIIQPGDNFVTLPLIWDSTAQTMRRSNGLGVANPEVPAGKAMDYYMGRLWVQSGNRLYTAGDIVYGSILGRHSIVAYTENAYLAGGGAFSVPSNAGAIRSICHTAALDTALGQGQLIIGTRDALYALTVPVDRDTWNKVNNTSSTSTDMPIQRVIQVKYGTVAERAVVKINGDLFYQSFDGVRSLQMAIRYFNQWGQIPLSNNENRVLQFNDRSLLRFASGIEFDNRVLQTVLPFQTPVGVAHKGIMPLDFDLISSLAEQAPPAWEGMYEGLDFLQLLESSDGGLQRAFAFVHSQATGKIQVWELTTTEKFEDSDKRVSWYFETPAYVWGNMFQLKELDSLELWFDKIFGTVNVLVDYRVDNDPCWINWQQFQMCTARTSCEDVHNPVCYPETQYRECYKRVMLPHPPVRAEGCTGRPSNIGFMFQFRVTIKGWCRVRSMIGYAKPRERAPYEGMVTT